MARKGPKQRSERGRTPRDPTGGPAPVQTFRARRRARSRRLRFWVAGVVLVGLATGAGAALAWWSFVRDLPDFDTLADYRPALSSVVVDRDGRPIGEFFEYRRRLTPLDEVPEQVIQAFLAAEDDTFYEHSGVDYLSILRAAWANLRAGGETVQGASTITQQTVKQLLLSSERTYRRKIRELILARRLERRFSKDEILFLYLNQIYFGSGAYGIGEASRTYFGRPISEVTTGEAALLAGLPKAPGRNSPFLAPERAEERRRYVLDRMLAEGFIDEDAHRLAVETPPRLVPPFQRDASETAAYFLEEVRRALVDRLGNDPLLTGGLTVETTLDLELQEAALRAVRNGLEALDQRQGYRGPLRTVAPAEIAGELDRLAEENALEARELPDEADRLDPESPLLPTDRPLVGVVVAVDAGAGRARVAFAPGREALIGFEDVTWARRAEAERRREPRSIDEVLSVGDVARFRVQTPDQAGEKRSSDTGALPAGARAAVPSAVLYQRPLVQGALLSFDVHTGDVVALVGGYDFEQSEFDRATQAFRQPGSAFKPLIYATALGRGYTPASIVYDRPAVYEDDESGFVWRPENYGREFLGALTISEALARSVNNATIHLLQDVGVAPVIELARRLGITAPLERNLGLALGVSPVTLLELTRAYAIFAAGGRMVRPRFVTRVLDREGNVLLEDLVLGEETADAARPAALPDPGGSASAGRPAAGRPGPEPSDPFAEVFAEAGDAQVLPSTQAYLTTALLRGVVEHPRGTGRRLRSLGRPLAGKTGTTNDQGDAWFIGFSPDVATGVWVGFDERRVLGRGETGSRAAAPIWIEYMGSALARWPARDFAVPPGIVFARIDPHSGLLASAAAEDSLFQPFLEGTEPRETAEDALSAAESRRLRLDF